MNSLFIKTYHKQNLIKDLESNGFKKLIQYVEEFYYILATINVHILEEIKIENGYAILKGKYIQNILGSNHATEILNALIKINYIERDKYYQVGKKSYGYKLKEVDSKSEWYTITNPALQKKINKYITNRPDALTINLMDKDMQKLYPMLYWEHKSNIEVLKKIDAELLQKKLDSLTIVSNDRDKFELLENEIRQDQYDTANYMISRIRNKDLYYRINKDGKVFTNLNMIFNKIRLACMKDVVEIDIKSSQWIKFVIECKKYIKSNSMTQLEYAKPLNNINYTLNDIKPNLLQEDVDKMQKIVEIEDIYTYIKPKETKLDRKRVKLRTFSNIIFVKNEITEFENNKWAQRFKEEFPEMYKYMYNYKAIYGHSSFANLLQSIESNIIVDSISIPLNHAGIENLTVHDSIIVNKKDVETATNQILSIYKHYGITPQVTTKGETNV